MDWLGHFFGLDNASGVQYLWWSGVGSDLSEIALIAGAYALLRHHNCAVRGCWRIGLRKVAGTEHTTCHKHHPHAAPTAQQVLDDHATGQIEGWHRKDSE